MKLEISVPKIADEVRGAAEGVSTVLAKRPEVMLDGQLSFVAGGPILSIYQNHNIATLIEEFRTLYPSDLIPVRIDEETDLTRAAALINGLRTTLGKDIELILNGVHLPPISEPASASTLTSALLRAMHAQAQDGDFVLTILSGSLTSLTHTALAIRNSSGHNVTFSWTPEGNPEAALPIYVRATSTVGSVRAEFCTQYENSRGKPYERDGFPTEPREPADLPNVSVEFLPPSLINQLAISEMQKLAASCGANVTSTFWGGHSLTMDPNADAKQLLHRYEDILANGFSRVTFHLETDFDLAAEIAIEMCKRLNQPLSVAFNSTFFSVDSGCDLPEVRKRFFDQLKLETVATDLGRIIRISPNIRGLDICSCNALAVAKIFCHPVECSFPVSWSSTEQRIIITPHMTQDEAISLFKRTIDAATDQVIDDLWGEFGEGDVF